jgi:hypothetical protein
MSQWLQKVHHHYLSRGNLLKKTKEMALSSVILCVSHMKKVNFALKSKLQRKRCYLSQLWMPQPNIMFVFLQVLKSVLDPTVKVKENLQMEVSSALANVFFCIFIYTHSCYSYDSNLNWYQRHAPKVWYLLMYL